MLKLLIRSIKETQAGPGCLLYLEGRLLCDLFPSQENQDSIFFVTEYMHRLNSVLVRLNHFQVIWCDIGSLAQVINTLYWGVNNELSSLPLVKRSNKEFKCKWKAKDCKTHSDCSNTHTWNSWANTACPPERVDIIIKIASTFDVL